MKRFAVAALLLAVVMVAAASAVSPSCYQTVYGLFFTDSSTGAVRAVTDADPLPITAKGATSFQRKYWLVGTSPSSWTLDATTTDVTLCNLGATGVWFDFNSGSATVSQSLPLTAAGTTQSQQGRDVGPGTVVWAVASVPTYVFGFAGGR